MTLSLLRDYLKFTSMRLQIRPLKVRPEAVLALLNVAARSYPIDLNTPP